MREKNYKSHSKPNCIFFEAVISSAEKQKDVNAIKQSFVENQKSSIAIDFVQ